MILVALCFVAVLGIALTSYLAVCSRAMQLSNRSFQADLSRQLAEAGIDEALRAFNKSVLSGTDTTAALADWSNSGTIVNWTLDTTNKRATATMTFPSSKFGQGVTGTVKIRVDNYDARLLGSTWISSKNYRIGDQVGYGGTWYSCVRNHSNVTPAGLATLAYWVPEPFPWKWRPGAYYYNEDVVNYDHDNDGIGTWFRCTANHTAPTTWSSTNWATISTIADYSGSYYSHADGDIFYYPNSTTWYRWIGASPSTTYTTSPAIGISWKYDSTKQYKFNDLVCYGTTYTWYRFINATPTAGQPPTTTTYWENALTAGAHAWLSSSIVYNVGDVVYYGSTNQWYRCIVTHTSSATIIPTNTAYWTNSPLLSKQWKSGPYYGSDDLVAYNGVWYRCIVPHTGSATILPTNTGYWIGANTTTSSYKWNSTGSYSAGAFVCYGGAWYKCLTANSGISPNNTTYWSSSWTQSAGVNTGVPIVYAEGTVTIGDRTTSLTQLRALIGPASLFPNAAASTTTLNIGGGTGTIDSYDSTLSTSYASQVGTTTNYSAVLAAGTASTNGTSALLTINNTHTVQGYVSAPPSTSSPYAPRISFGTSSIVKSATSSPLPLVDLTRVSRSPYVPQFTPLPSQTLATGFASMNFPYGRSIPTNFSGTDNTVNLGTPGATTPARYYYNTTLNIGTTYDILTLNINGPVKLYINGNLYLRSGGTLQINANCSAEIHVNGAIRTFSGAPGFVNLTQNPKSLFLISDVNTTTAQQFLAPTPSTNYFYGTIYVPNTTATLGLDIRTGVVIYGALSGSEVTFSNEANVHYDTSLRYTTFDGVDQPYTVTNWSELGAAEAATMP